MSGIFRAIGKVFKSVVKVVKKFALPALAIGAVIMTGGAAIGALPSLGSLLGAGGLGLSAGLTSAITTAATSATIGAGMSLITGGDPLKGATMGLITGGALGGIGALTGIGGAASGAATGAQTAAETMVTLPSTGASIGLPAVGGAATGIGGATAAAAPAIAGATSAGSGGVLGGIVNFLGKNPVITGNLINGIGAGLSNSAALSAQRDRDQQIRDNYSDTSGLFQITPGPAPEADPQRPNGYSDVIYGGGNVAYDRTTGRIYRVGAR